MAPTLGILATLAALLLSPALALGDAHVHSYALVIGSNHGGEGQSQLAFAQRDADNMATVLRELGRTPAEHIERLNDPTPAQVEAALTKLRGQLSIHAAAGEHAQLIFYYSGHARASALSLGEAELPLSELRASLLALPSTLTVVVLDACQSGAFSGVKGASPATDFSVQSVQGLNSSGVAVMASSTGSEPALAYPARIAPDVHALGLDTLCKLSDRVEEAVMETLIYRFYDELGQEEIASVMNVSRKTVQNRLNRAAEALQALAPGVRT